MMCARALTLWCAVVAIATAAAYTVDCNHEYTDCDTELSKLTAEDDDSSSATTIFESKSLPETAPSSTAMTASITIPPTRSTPRIEVVENRTEVEQTTLVTDVTEQVKPKARLLNLNVDDLQSFANALHNQTGPKNDHKKLPDLSDVNLDGDEDDDMPRLKDNEPIHKNLPDKFYSNLQAPFHPLLSEVRGSDELETCKDNEVTYKVGERIDRGCEETCECSSGGAFECFPRCKHPYIRRGRRLNDPLCFESPVDECCSIIACATGNEPKPTKIEICRYGNDTYPVGTKWNIGCEQTCTCERNSVVTCKPRCNVLPPSDSCINVQDPSDACCEVQICDVSQDAHEEPAENATSSTTTTSSTTEVIKRFEDVMHHSIQPSRPLVLAEPIGSVKVLHNNTVQVNLIHMNNTEDPIHLLLSNDGGKTFRDVQLKYSNLILNLEGGKDYILKTKETGTKFNFTITMSDNANEVPTEELHNITKVGCYQDGKFYAVGEEFHIGCTELCECTGPDTKECAALACPSHVGLEIMSKGCVRWAPSPTPIPPNCCPRAAKCLSDGTCDYKGIPVPNWTEVPVSVTGCEQRCFCENGELDCQEACSPLPTLPPQSLRCPPMHRPAPVNISDEDCCKQWGCVPNAGITNETTYYSIMTVGDPPLNYVTPVAPILPTLTTSVLVTPQNPTDPTDFFKHLNPVKTMPKLIANSMSTSNDIHKYSMGSFKSHSPSDNITVFTLDDITSPFKMVHPDPSLSNSNVRWEFPIKTIKTLEPIAPRVKIEDNEPDHMPRSNFILTDAKMHDLIDQTQLNEKSIFHNYFVPKKNEINSPITPISNKFYFQPSAQNLPSNSYILTKDLPKEVPQTNYKVHPAYDNRRKHVTILHSKDLQPKPTDSVTNEVLWKQDTKSHLLTKVPNPYETVLSRVPTAILKPTTDHNTAVANIGSKIYSPLDLEHLLSQMEVESEVNRNLGRSADKNNIAVRAGPSPDDFPARPPHPSFLPTVPPQIHFPQEDIPDYDQNNIHRPTLEGLPGLPPGLPIPTHYGDDNKKLTVLSLQSDSPTSVKMLFGLPPVLVGLRGSVDLRYTDQADDDISHWYSQVFAPTDEVLTTPRLEFTLSGLKPSTTYKIRGKLFLHNLPVEPESEIRAVRTLDLPSVIASSVPVEEKRREVDSRLVVMEANDTAAHVSWRHFSEDELQLIDGIQIRYRPIGTPIYSMTELLHHSRSAAELHDLRPGTRYEASMVLVPPPRAVTELHDPGRVEFTTSPYVDPYNWTVTIEARAVGSEAAELTWRGVPSPAERWVRVYRAAHACGTTTSSRREHDAFRLAARDLPPAVTLTGLEPNTRCRVWLELFLTNGKVKTSNVLEINTKSLDEPEPIDNEIESASVAGSRTSPRGDYYGALVVVGVVAALGALTSLLLLLVVVRRHRPRSVPITPVPSAPRDSSLPPYDNPAYKLELQQETMDL